jgi:two-component system sensor histidine kinase MtrB
VMEEPIAAEEPGEIELRPEEITWQPAEPVDATPADKAANEVSEEVR